MEDAGQ